MSRKIWAKLFLCDPTPVTGSAAVDIINNKYHWYPSVRPWTFWIWNKHNRATLLKINLINCFCSPFSTKK